MDKNSMIRFIQQNADASADQSAIAQYYMKKSEDEVRADYQRLLIGEQMKIVAADAETQKAKQAAAAQIAETAQALRDLRWAQLCAHNFNGRSVANVVSNRQIIEGWAQDKQVTPAFLQSVVDSNPQIKLAWVKHESPQDIRQRSQEIDEQTKRILLGVCQRYNLSYSEANQNAVLFAFPHGLVDAHELETAIQNGTVSLHGANADEIDQFTKELVRAHNVRWTNKSIAELKAGSAQERMERESIFNRVSPTPAAPVGVQPLPPQITQQIILEKLNSGDRAAVATWRARYGIQAVNARLQGLA